MKRELLIVRAKCTPGEAERAEGADRFNILQKSSCQTPTFTLSRWEECWALKRVGRERKQEEVTGSISLPAGGIRGGVVEESRRWCSSESCVSFVPFSLSHFSALVKLTEEREHHDLELKREVSKSKMCAQAVSLCPLVFAVGIRRKESRRQGRE